MAAPDDSYLKNLIASNLPDNGQPRGIKPAIIRATLNSLIDWVKTGINNTISTWLRVSDGQPGGSNTEAVYRMGQTVFGRKTVDGSAALQATTFKTQFLNDIAQTTTFNTSIADAGPAIKYVKILSLPVEGGGTLDFAYLEAVVGAWGGLKTKLNLMVSNRGGFAYRWSQEGDTINTASLVAYNNGGAIDVYCKMDNGFKQVTVTIPMACQATSYSPLQAQNDAPGTLVFDTSDGTKYPPVTYVSSGVWQNGTPRIKATAGQFENDLGQVNFSDNQANQVAFINMAVRNYSGFFTIRLTFDDGDLIEREFHIQRNVDAGVFRQFAQTTKHSNRSNSAAYHIGSVEPLDANTMRIGIYRINAGQVSAIRVHVAARALREGELNGLMGAVFLSPVHTVPNAASGSPSFRNWQSVPMLMPLVMFQDQNNYPFRIKLPFSFTYMEASRTSGISNVQGTPASGSWESVAANTEKLIYVNGQQGHQVTLIIIPQQ